MDQSLLGVIAVAAIVLVTPKLGYEWRGAINRLTLANGLFCFSVLCGGILRISGTKDWESLWTFTGSFAAAAGGIVLFRAVTGLPRADSRSPR